MGHTSFEHVKIMVKEGLLPKKLKTVKYQCVQHTIMANLPKHPENQRTTIQSQNSHETRTSSVSGSIGVPYSGFYSPTQGSPVDESSQTRTQVTENTRSTSPTNNSSNKSTPSTSTDVDSIICLIMLRSQDCNEQIMDMRKQHLLLKAQKEERKKKAKENCAEELEINRVKINVKQN